MKIWVTGESGFIAQNLTERWSRNEKHIVLNSLSEPSFDYWRNSITAGRKKEINIFDPTLKKLISNADPDLIIHAAALTDKRLCEESPDLATHINVDGTVQICKIAKTLNIPVLFLSSSDAHVTKQCGTSIYAITKRAAEEMAQYFSSGNKTIVLPQLFGKYDLNGDISKLFVSLNSTKDFEEIDVDPENIKNYLYIEEAVEAIEKFIEDFTKLPSRVFVPGARFTFEEILNYCVDFLGIVPCYELRPEFDTIKIVEPYGSNREEDKKKIWEHLGEMKALYDNKRTD